ncbi:hypothetical protein [uncultured Shewanella sp.]|uniref:hypothetical protein n=1 Tax=uncultured Shewanella sp. TaxID=173975 RepID=UPI00262F8E2F|nr:hypothetical protein [uncultured Shewanella sp.]
MILNEKLFTNMINLNHLLNQYQIAAQDLHLEATIDDKVKKLALCKKILNDIPLSILTIKSHLLTTTNTLEPYLLTQLNLIEAHMDKIKRLLKNE